MIELTETQIDVALARLESGLTKYCWIQANVQQRDVSRDAEFQRKFNDFYKVRQKSMSWYAHYYALVESAKATGIGFPEALRALKDRVGSIEASFASKLVATIDPTKPVIDQFVLRNFGLRRPYYGAPNREAKWIELYENLCRSYEDLIASAIGLMAKDKFTDLYPWAAITDLKKIDLVLWQIRPE